jgi:hypothetical protein
MVPGDLLAKRLVMGRCSESQSPLLCSFARTRLPSALQPCPPALDVLLFCAFGLAPCLEVVPRSRLRLPPSGFVVHDAVCEYRVTVVK